MVFSQTIGPIELKFHVKTPYDKLAKIYTKYFGHMTNMTATPQTWGKLIVNANALLMHYFFPVIQGNDLILQFLNYFNANSMHYYCQNSLYYLHYFELLSNIYFSINIFYRLHNKEMRYTTKGLVSICYFHSM